MLATIDADARPCAIAFDDKAAWVTSYAAGTVMRIDLATNAITDRIKVGAQPCGIALGADGRIWVAVLGQGRVVAIDRSSLMVTAQIGSLDVDLWDLKAGHGSIWVVDRDSRLLLRIDPATARIVKRIPIGPLGGGLAVTGSAVWVADASDGTIRRVDPSTSVAAVTATVQGGAIWFSDDGDGHLAVSGTPGGPVTVLDSTTGKILSSVKGWTIPRDGTVIGNTAWIPDGGAQAVRLLDLGTNVVTATYGLPNSLNPFVAEPGGGDLFILDYGGTTIWRIRP